MRKARKLRGSRTHGWGKEHRCKGQKGGRGRAGSGKRSDAKKPSFWFQPLGRQGFCPRVTKPEQRAIDFRQICQRLGDWSAQGLVRIEAGMPAIDLTALGYTKLLANGRPERMTLRIAQASQRAIAKLRAVGGQIVQTSSAST